MFKQKRIQVQIGDIFIERVHRKKHILSLLGIPSTIDIFSLSNKWYVTGLYHFDSMPHAELETLYNNCANSTKRLIAVDALEMEEHYQRLPEN